MPAINFQKRFADAVERGDKRQTIRAPRRDGRPTATVGDRLYLYVGMRTKGCRKLGEGVCVRTAQVFITEEHRIHVGGLQLGVHGEEEFAEADGFENYGEMVDWFERIHGLPFEGALIGWMPTSDSDTTEND